MAITKAIIPVAGWGTRRLPITKTIEKCMLPIGNRPLVDYVVQDALAAGITDIYFVVSQGSTQLQSYYGDNTELVQYLEANGKTDYISLVTPPQNVQFHYVVQGTAAKYGTAIPVALVAEQHDIQEPLVVLMGDDFIYNNDGASETARLIAAAGDSDSVMLGVHVDPSEVSRYGVLEIDENNNFVQIVEKPSVEDAPSTLINVSKYVLSTEALAQIRRYAAEERQGEYYITDPVNSYVTAGGVVRVVPARGTFLDGGTAEGWLYANNVVAGQEVNT